MFSPPFPLPRMNTLLFILDPFLWLLWIAWSAQAVLSVLVVRKFARRYEKERRPQHDRYRPPAAVIVPFKGIDPGLQENLRHLCEQFYPQYRLVLVVESEDDPAYPVLRRAVEQCTHAQVDLLVAGRAPGQQGQKVHNQLAAIAHLEACHSEEEVWVFADSDARLEPNWLGQLVGPLGEAPTGVTTGYRWLVPRAREGEDRPTIWAVRASVMNSTVACFAGRNAFNLAWGGSMALRRETAIAGDLKQVLAGSINDDYPVTLMVRRLGLRVYFVPHCVVASPVTFTFRELANFAHRQWLLTRIYAPRLLAIAVALHGLFVLAFVSAWVRLGVALFHHSARWWPAALAIVVVFGANQDARGDAAAGDSAHL